MRSNLSNLCYLKYFSLISNLSNTKSVERSDWTYGTENLPQPIYFNQLPRSWLQCRLHIWRGFLHTSGFLWERPSEVGCSRVSNDGRRQPKKSNTRLFKESTMAKVIATVTKMSRFVVSKTRFYKIRSGIFKSVFKS